MHKVPMIGKKHGRLTVVSLHGSLGGERAWLCLCDCGKETIVRGYQLRKGDVKSCGCYRREYSKVLGDNRRTHGRSKTVLYRLLYRAALRAKKQGVPIDLTLDDMPSIPDNCPILGIPLKVGIGKGPSDSSPSMDRLIPSLGYVKGNVRIISNRANQIKNNATTDELRLILADALSIVTIKAA